MIMASEASGMNNRRLETLIREIGDSVEGKLGFWQFNAYGQRLICVTDESHDRLRVMVPIVEESELDSEQLATCMAANFDRALDARYCFSDGTLWGAFIHPLGCLTSAHFRSGCQQVAELAKNFGTSYSSGVLRFGG